MHSWLINVVLGQDAFNLLPGGELLDHLSYRFSLINSYQEGFPLGLVIHVDHHDQPSL